MDLGAIDRIKEKIIQDATLAGDNIIADANKEAESILSEASVNIGRIKLNMLKNAQKEAEHNSKRMLSTAQLENKKLILKTKQDVISLCYDKVLENLLELSEDEYIELLYSFIKKGLISEKADLLLSKRDKELYSEKLILFCRKKDISCDLSISNDTANISGGVIIKSGMIESNYSFNVIIKMLRNLTESETIKILFD